MEKLNQAEVANLLGVDVKTIRNYQKLEPGLPFNKVNATTTEYEPTEVVQWFVDYRLALFKANEVYTTEDKKLAEAREAFAKAELREIEVAKEHRKLILVSDVEKTWTDLILTVKRHLLNVPHRLAMAIEDGLTYEEKKEKGRLIIEEILKFLATDEKKSK